MRILLSAALAAGLALTGCGSDDDSDRIASRATTSTSGVEDTTTSSALAGDTTTTAAPAAAGTATTAARRSAPATTRPAGGSPGTTAAPAPPPGQTTTTAPPPGQPPPPDINIQNFTFNPPVLDVAVGKTVTAKNLDGAAHTWTADDNSWDSKTLAKDQTYSHTFTKAGNFAYHCAIHPSMKGTVNVR